MSAIVDVHTLPWGSTEDRPYGALIEDAETLAFYWEAHAPNVQDVERMRDGIDALNTRMRALIAAIEPYNMTAYAHLAERHQQEHTRDYWAARTLG